MFKLFNGVLITQIKRETDTDIFWNKYKASVLFKDICNYNDKYFIKNEEMNVPTTHLCKLSLLNFQMICSN